MWVPLKPSRSPRDSHRSLLRVVTLAGDNPGHVRLRLLAVAPTSDHPYRGHGYSLPPLAMGGRPCRGPVCRSTVRCNANIRPFADLSRNSSLVNFFSSEEWLLACQAASRTIAHGGNRIKRRPQPCATKATQAIGDLTSHSRALAASAGGRTGDGGDRRS
ncbi:hypothetical protein BHM03_00058752 [Ensete ventricosum]|nr:hypothetical protein BHM03_00058752 [Ensete ventricosum]